MKSIPLHGKNGKGKYFIVSDDKYELVKKYPWKLRGKYPCTVIRGKFVYAHRMILGDIPDGMVGDHKNGCVLCDWNENLRVVTQLENIKNQHHNKKGCGYNHELPIQY